MLISNSSTLILLAKISALKLFLENYAPIEVPKAVYEEIIIKTDQLDTLIIMKEIENGTIKINDKKPKNIDKILNEFRLDNGEAAVYCLYLMQEYKGILTDDGELIKLCKISQIPFLCSLAIVIRMYEKNILTKKEALEKINNLAKYGRYSKEIIEYYYDKVK